MSADAAAPNEVTLAVRNGDLIGPVLGRVVSMLAARAHCPIDRLDDALLLTDAIAAHAGDQALNGQVVVHIATDETGIRLRVGALRAGGAKAMLEAAELPGVGNVFERVAHEVGTAGDGDGDGEQLVVQLAFAG